MNISINSPAAVYSFGDTGDEAVKASISGVGPSITTAGQKTPGGIELSSSSTTSGKGIVVTKIVAKVPILSFDSAGQVVGASKFVQTKIEVTIPNAAGVITTSGEVSSGQPTTQAAANAIAVAQGLQLLLAEVCDQGSGVLAASKSLISYTLFGTDLSNPITRGAMGVLPVDGTDRSVKNAT